MQETKQEPRRPVSLPDTPSIAVLPFVQAGNDFDAQAFADGVTDNVIYTLACTPGLFVSGRNSIFTFKGRRVRPQQVGQVLGVAHVLEATIARGDERIALNARLTETGSGQTLWSERFEGSRDGVSALKRALVERTLATIAPGTALDQCVSERSRISSDVGIYEKFLLAYLNYSPSSEESTRAMYASLESIAGQLPGHPLPPGLMAQCYTNLVAQGWSRDLAGDAAAATRLARTALAYNDTDPTVLMMVGHTLGYLGRDHDTGLALLDRSLALNPNSASTYERSGWVRCFADEPETARAHFHAAKRLSPLDNATFRFDSGLGVAHCMLGQYEEALAWLQRAILDTPSWTSSYRLLAACLAHLGRQAEAKAAARELLTRQPDFRIAPLRWPFKPSVGLERIVEGLRQAGLPD